MLLVRMSAAIICCALVTIAWQKVEIKDVDSAVKKAAADQAAAAKEQLSASRSAAESNVLERYKQQERANSAKQAETDRFKVLEDGLRQVREDRAKEVNDEKQARETAAIKAVEDHEDLMRVLRNSSIGVVASLVGALVLYLFKFASDKRHHAMEERQIDGLVATSNHIKGLVNSTYTAALQGRLDANRIALAALLEVASSAKRHQEDASPDTAVLIAEAHKTIAELEVTLADRLKV